MKLWVFGDSLSLPYHIDNESDGWPALLAKQLNCELENLAKPAADNFYIYSSYQHAAPNIKQNDIVVVGWSHPSRKSFILDRLNPTHTNSLEYSFVYNAGVEFIRSKNQLNDTLEKWSKLLPTPRNKPFYDTWYQNYYSEFEQRSNLAAYHRSISATCPGQYLAFFFSEESINGLDVQPYAGTMLEFISNKNCSISPQDAHLSVVGHQLWERHIYNYARTHRAKSIFPVIELIDRYAIAELKFSKSQANLEEVEFYKTQLKYYNLELISQDFSELYQVHAEIWNLEAELKSGQENKLSLEELGRRAIAIRNYNHRRIELKNKIAETFGDVVREIKKDHLSQ